MKTTFIKCLFFVVLMSAVYSASAKKDSVKQYRDFKNTVILSNSYFYFPKIFGKWNRYLPFLELQPGDQFSISFERKVYKNIRVGGCYTTWNMVPALTKIYTTNGPEVGFYPWNTTHTLGIGDADYRRAYKMLDLYGAYQFKHFGRHMITVGAGVSYTWGINNTVDTIIYIPGYRSEPHYEFIEKKADYYGAFVFLRYDYRLFKNRASVGVNFDRRKYQGLYSDQIDYGFHVNINF